MNPAGDMTNINTLFLRLFLLSLHCIVWFQYYPILAVQSQPRKMKIISNKWILDPRKFIHVWTDYRAHKCNQECNQECVWCVSVYSMWPVCDDMCICVRVCDFTTFQEAQVPLESIKSAKINLSRILQNTT